MKHTISLKESRVFRRLYAKGNHAVAGTLVIYCRKNGRPVNRLGLTASTKLGNAVTRNLLRRRMRELYRCHEDRILPGYDLIIVARGRAVGCPYAKLERDFLRLLDQLPLSSHSPASGPSKPAKKSN